MRSNLDLPRRLDARVVIDVLVILASVLIVFGRSLTQYFLADDFGEIHYIDRIFNGDLSMLLANFTGNYMQIPGMSVYRPFLLLSLMLDFFFWRGNAFGYYLTNVSFYFLDALLLYFIVGSLCTSGSAAKNRLTALFAALVFALSPLHCESVSWVLGRVDIVCAFFYLVALLLVIKSLTKNSSRLIYGAVAAYISALLVKEMAIGIPVLALALGFLFKDKTQPLLSAGRFGNAFKFSLPYIVATLAYFVVRYLCLGTLTGGYVAGFGASQETSLLARWLDTDTVRRIAFPLVLDHFGNEKSITVLLTVFYAMTMTIFMVFLCARKYSLKLLLFLTVWAFTTLLPIYKLWGLGYHLEGSRFIFFFTMPLSALFATMLFQGEAETGSSRSFDRALLLVSSVVAIGCLCVYGCVATKTNLIWVSAGKEVRATALAARRILAEAQNKPAIFLGIPEEWKGSHMILNGDTFRALINPPFASRAPRRAFATFEPIMYAPVHDLDVPRLKTLVGSGADVYVWAREKREFLPVHFTGAAESKFDLQSVGENVETSGLFKRSKDGLLLVDAKQQAQEPGIILSHLNLNPLSVDFLAVQLRLKGSGQDKTVSASWNEAADSTDPESSVSCLWKDQAQNKTLYLPLSRRWTWFQKPSIERIFIGLPKGTEAEVTALSLLAANKVAPALKLENSKANENGIYVLTEPEAQLTLDASQLKGATSLMVEISKANYFFDNFRKDEGAEAVATQISYPNTFATVKLPRQLFKGKGFFQLRARALDADRKPILAASSGLTLQLR